MEQLHTIQLTKRELGLLEFKLRFLYANIAVSYTHLTLPTICSV